MPSTSLSECGRAVVVVAAAVLAMTPSPPAFAAEKPEAGTLSLLFENDLFYDTDRNYTNGVRAAWLTGPDRTPAHAARAARWFPLFPGGGTLRASYAVGQNMYTPRDIRTANPPRDDRPYAGWLYGSVGLIAETGQRLDQLELTLGVVGPAALAEQAQTTIHGFTNSNAPRGWDTQLGNEPGVVLAYQRSWRGFVSESVSGLDFDVKPHAGGALGNVFTYGNVGLMLRLGERLPLDYGPPRIQPSLTGSGYFLPRDGFGWYGFFGVEARGVARNIFLDGNTFRDSRGVDKQPLVGDLQFGVAATFRNLRLSYTHVLRTREFKGQSEHADFGAFSLSARF
jgi:lipid A 3-O-deacylase